MLGTPQGLIGVVQHEGHPRGGGAGELNRQGKVGDGKDRTGVLRRRRSACAISSTSRLGQLGLRPQYTQRFPQRVRPGALGGGVPQGCVLSQGQVTGGADDERPPGGVGQGRQGGGGRTGLGVLVVIAEHRLQQRHWPAAPGVDGLVGDAAGARGPQGAVLELGDGGLMQPGRVPRPVQVFEAYGDDPVAGGTQARTFVGVVGEAVVRATGVEIAAVGEDGDGTAAAGAQAGEVGAGAAGVKLGTDPPAAPVDLQRGRARRVAGGAHGHLLAQELGECGAEARLQGALPGAGAHGLVGDRPLGEVRVELGEHAFGVLGAGVLPSQELADGVQGCGAGHLSGDGVGPQAVRAHVLALGAARAALQVLAGADEEVPDAGGVVMVGEITGASGHSVVQQESGTGLAGGAAGHGVGDGGNAQVVG